MQLKSILEEVAAEITPAEKPAEIEKFLKQLNSALKKKRLNAKAVLGGSYAKDVWLKGDYDIDIFVLFNLKYKSHELSDLLAKVLKRWKPLRALASKDQRTKFALPSRIHGSRDYFLVRDKINFEIIPVLGIKKAKDAKNVTDFSPWHVKWVLKHGKKYRNDIRLAKKFMKAQGVYGAESYIRGFSGHVVDILVIYFKGFLPLLKAASRWKPKVVIDFYRKYKGKVEFLMNKSKIEGPLIVIDPVQPDRNAAAALELEKFNRFTIAARKFLKQPSKSFFVEKQVDFTKLKSKGHLVMLTVQPIVGREDVAGAKLRSAFEFLQQRVSEFKLMDSGWIWKKACPARFWFLFRHRRLRPTVERQGPPLRITAEVARFRKVHKKTFEKRGRVWAVVERKFTTPEEIVKALANDSYFKQRVSSWRLNG